jgi:hypothetical protein
MSKVIVDQIQKNGGTTFTLPSADGSSANKPLVTNGSGTLAFSPLSMPAADGTANKPITTDGSGQLQFNPNALPTTIGLAGQQLAVNSGATALEYISAPTPNSPTYSKTYDFKTLSATGTHDITWASINSDIQYSKVAGVSLSMYEVSSSSNCYIYIYSLNSSGSPVTTGYYSNTYHGRYNTNSMNGYYDNSNNGWMRFPAYGNNIGETNSSYGQGITGQIMLIPWREGSSHEETKGGGSFYSIMYQSSSHNYPNAEHGGYNNYGTSSAADAMEGGFRFYATSGNFNHGRLVVEVHMKEG